MKIHHTKNKGDLGVAKAQCDLMEKGYTVLIPLSEHQDFDLVAYDNSKFIRIQVKYRSAVNDVLFISFRSSWADKNGSHSINVDKSNIDVYCIYCPETDKCYYFNPRDFKGSASLRITETKNNQSKNIHIADDYLNIPL